MFPSNTEGGARGERVWIKFLYLKCIGFYYLYPPSLAPQNADQAAFS